MKRWLLSSLFACACDSGEAKPAEPASQATPSKAAPEAEAEAEPEPEPEPIEAEWIVWFRAEGGTLQSRWYTKTASGVTQTAARKAVVIGDGKALWHVRRADAKADVYACACIESEKDPGCTKTGEVTTLGLEAVPMDGGKPVSLQTASSEAIYGEVEGMSLSLRGGVGEQLFVEVSDAGYYCGAHGSYGGAILLRDPSVAVPPSWPELTLPDAMLKQAVVSGHMLKDYQECWDEPDVGIDAFIHDIMKVVSVELSLDAGMPKLRWHTEADGPYVCTGDYAFHGWVDSGLLPSAASLGLAPPLPEGLPEALKDVGSAEAFGFAPIDASIREQALAWYAGLDETPWPSENSTQRSVRAAPTPEASQGHRKLLERGRKLTRDKDYAQAVKVLTEAIEANPTAARPYAARCYAHLLAGSLREARTDCDTVLTMQPDDRFAASVHYNLGQIAQAEGKTVEAKAAYEASLALRENGTVRKALEALEPAPK